MNQYLSLNSYVLNDLEKILVIPKDTVIKGRDGRTLYNNNPSLVIQSFSQSKVELPIDIEHSTFFKGTKGDPAPAMGWITDLYLENEEVWASVKWTDKGKELIETKQYRYYSPAYLLDDKNQIVALHSVGLTNKPNLLLPSLNNQRESLGGKDMDKKQMLTLLGLNAEATDDEIKAKIGNLLKVSANNESYVPKQELEVALNRASTLEAELKKVKDADFNSRKETAINSAIEDGKISPASKKYYETSCNSEQSLKEFVEAFKDAPKLIDVNSSDNKNPDKKITLNSEQKAMAVKFGLSEEEVIKEMKNGEEK
ncbi:MAG: phage protease [Pleomorphochaeta sp.]